MKKLLIITLVVSLSMVGLVLNSFGKEKPRYGGDLRIIYNAGPRILGYSLEQGPGDLFVLLNAVEKVVEFNDKQELVPWLAESVDVNDQKKTITIKMRKGIKFHDGSDCDAGAIAWNYEQQVANKRIGYLDKWGSMDVVDKYTLVIHYKGGYNNQLIMGWLWSPPIYSKEAFEKAGGGDIEKSKEWARSNVSGTGPFKLLEYKRDDHMTLVRFDDYWGDKPYLDRITYLFIPDSVTASAMMQAGQADWWLGTPIKDQVDLEKKGLIRKSGPGNFGCIVPNIANPESKWKDKRLRQALEYALDKPAIAKALGFGYYSPMKMLAPEGEWGYDPTYEGHPYNPEKAKQLLAEAGYPQGFNFKLLAMIGNQDAATAIKSYLDAVGMTVDIDIADPGRFFGSLWVKGWDDLILWGTIVLGDMLATMQINYGDQPLTRMASASWVVPPELVALCKDSRTYPDKAGQEAATNKIIRWVADQSLIIPLYVSPAAYIIQPYVHTTYLQQTSFTFYFAKFWMDKH
jgi:ABC-type transport system substrate-binding protein